MFINSINNNYIEKLTPLIQKVNKKKTKKLYRKTNKIFIWYIIYNKIAKEISN